MSALDTDTSTSRMCAKDKVHGYAEYLFKISRQLLSVRWAMILFKACPEIGPSTFMGVFNQIVANIKQQFYIETEATNFSEPLAHLMISSAHKVQPHHLIESWLALQR